MFKSKSRDKTLDLDNIYTKYIPHASRDTKIAKNKITFWKKLIFEKRRYMSLQFSPYGSGKIKSYLKKYTFQICAHLYIYSLIGLVDFYSSIN